MNELQKEQIDQHYQNIHMINHDAVLCGHYNVQQYNEDSIVHHSRLMWYWFVAAAKSFVRCINDYENVQKQMKSAETSMKVHHLLGSESVYNALQMNEIYCVDNEGNTEICVNAHEHSGSQCTTQDK